MTRTTKITAIYSLLIATAILVIACQHTPPVETKPESPACPADDATPPMAQYMKIMSADRPQISPDGVTYYMTWTTGVNQIYRVKDGEDLAVTTADMFPEGMDFFTLSPDGAALVIEADEGGDEQYDLYWLDLTDPKGMPQALDKSRDVKADSVVFTPDARTVYYRCNRRNGRDFDVWRAGPQQNAELFIQSEGYLWLADIDPTGAWLTLVRYYGGDRSDVLLADLNAKTVKNLTNTPEEGGIFTAPMFAADGKSLLLASNAGREHTTLVRMSLADNNVTVLVDSPWEVENISLSPARDQVAYAVNEEGYSKIYVSALPQFSPKSVALPELSLVAALEINPTGLYVAGSSASKTGDVYRLDPATGDAAQLTFSDYAGIDTSPFVEPELIHYESFDGLKIPAFVYKPKNVSGPIPFVIYAHGGPEGQFRPAFIRNFQYFVSKGVGILAPNVRGSAGYTREYLEMDNYKKRMDSVRDYEAAAKYLIDSKLSAPGQLGIMGGSYGGFIVMACITEYPELFSAAVNKVGIVNFVTYFQNTSGYRQKVRQKEYGPMDDVEFLKSISPIFKVDQIQTPLLVVHGENDPRVPVDEARQIIAALEARDRTVEYLIFPDEGHGVGKLENRLKEYDVMADFFMRYLLGVPPQCLKSYATPTPQSADEPERSAQ